VRPNCEHTLPVLLSVDEVQRILGCLRLPRYRVCLSTIYTCGLRLQEWLAALGRALPAGNGLNASSTSLPTSSVSPSATGAS